MVEITQKGRAEFEEIKDCLEGVPASIILAQLFAYHGPSLLIGDRGSGKTHLIRLLQQEMPIEIYEIDKQKLRSDNTITFSKLTNPSGKETIAIVVDDLHYLIKMMQLSNLAEKPIIKEEDVLSKLDEIKKKASEKGAQLIFVADEGPGSLAMRFKEHKHKKQFLEILDGCVAGPDDEKIYYDILGRLDTRYATLDINRRGLLYFSLPGTVMLYSQEFINKVSFDILIEKRDISYDPKNKDVRRLTDKEKLRALAFKYGFQDDTEILEVHEKTTSFVEQVKKQRDKIPDTMLMSDYYGKLVKIFRWKIEDEIIPQLKETTERIVKKFNIKDIPVFYWSEYDSWAGHTNFQFFPINEHNIITPNKILVSTRKDGRRYKHTRWDEKEFIITPNTQIATIRQLKIISDDLKEISRDTLGLPKCGSISSKYSVDGNNKGMIYTSNELSEIKDKLSKIYYKVIGSDYLDLVSKLRNAYDDKGILTALIEYDLRFE